RARGATACATNASKSCVSAMTPPPAQQREAPRWLPPAPLNLARATTVEVHGAGGHLVPHWAGGTHRQHDLVAGDPIRSDAHPITVVRALLDDLRIKHI